MISKPSFRKSTFVLAARRLGAAGLLLAALHPGRALAAVVRLETLESAAPSPAGAEDAHVAAAAAEVDVARSAYMPTIGLTADASIAPGGRLVTVVDKAGDEYLVPGSRAIGESGALVPEGRYGAGLWVQQRIYDFGRTAATVRAAEAQVRSARADGDAARLGRVRAIRAAYMKWLAAWTGAGIVRRERDDARARRDALAGRVAEGTRPKSELAVVDVRLTTTELEVLRAEGEVQSARLDVESAVGAPLPPDATPDETLLDRTPAAAPASQTPELDAIDAQRGAALETARAASLGHAPVVTASAEAGVRGQTDQVFPVYRVGVSLVVPIWDGGAQSARAAAARARATELAARGGEIRGQREAARKHAQANVQSAAARIRVAQKLVELTEQLARDAEDRFRLGDGPAEAVLEARANRAKAERELVNAKLARAEAVLRMKD